MMRATTIAVRRRARLAGPAAERGQASIELLALLPLVALIALLAFALVASHAAAEQAGEAAEAGALALLQGGDLQARTAALDALPESTRRRATVSVSGRRVRVRVRLRLPLAALADQLAADVTTSAGPRR